MRNSSRWRMQVNGTVQGVGFRPFVYRLACELGISGHVFNSTDGVTIEAESNAGALEEFIERLRDDAPPLAHIHEITKEGIRPTGDAGFSIVQSKGGTASTTLISPDIAPCDDCLSEMNDPADRRYSYPFINCTNCGPRYTITKSLPYDRPQTTMRVFEMCAACRSEYENPADRRFHAQPNACDRCGPKLKFVRQKGQPKSESTDPISDTLLALEAGEIVAIKGLGGYHLACDALNDAAVLELRRRKRRDEKPFAIMVGGINTARRLCHISSDEERLLTSPQRPIVLLQKKEDANISDAIAPSNKNLGLMLPSTPLHSLLFHRNGGASRTLAMTSGNITDEPIAYKDDEAFSKLPEIADAFLIHDREIHVRIDDSITRCIDERPVIVRRARGYAPAPVRLSFDMPNILAAGADLKGSICLTKGRNAFLSQHLGDMENLEANRSFELAFKHMRDIFDVDPEIIAHDMHPEYFSTRAAKSFRKTQTIYAVQHHHAHIASCMAENDLPNESVMGIALDGTGFGMDGTIWGGEILIADYENFERAASLALVRMPGGDSAAKEPWRMALSYLHQLTFDGQTSAGHDKSEFHPFKEIQAEKTDFVQQMIEKNINSPLTSSCGRLFDAVAALTGIRTHNSFEGQAAMELEQIARETEDGCYDFNIAYVDGTSNGLRRIDFLPAIASILEDIRESAPPAIISARFHNTIIDALARACLIIKRNKQAPERICLSGGCFQNAILTAGLKKRLVEKGFRVYTHSLVPPNDGGIALGQAAIAAHRHMSQRQKN